MRSVFLEAVYHFFLYIVLDLFIGSIYGNVGCSLSSHIQLKENKNRLKQALTIQDFTKNKIGIWSVHL